LRLGESKGHSGGRQGQKLPRRRGKPLAKRASGGKMCPNFPQRGLPGVLTRKKIGETNHTKGTKGGKPTNEKRKQG